MRGPKCMTFYYSMYGKYMSCVLVYVKLVNGTRYLAWLKSGNRGDRWLEAQVFINETQHYQVVLEVIQGRDWSGQAAIDDIVFKNGSCSKNTDVFYVSTFTSTVYYKVDTMPQYDSWRDQLSFSARKTTGNPHEQKIFVYATNSGQYPIITRYLTLKYRNFPLDFFYDSHEANNSNTIYVLNRAPAQPQEIRTVNSSYEHCCTVRQMTSFSGVIRQESARCQGDWKGIGNSCYYFSIEDIRTWNGARERCRSLGGDLAVIQNLEALRNISETTDRITLGLFPYYVGLRVTVTNVTQPIVWNDGRTVDPRLWKDTPKISPHVRCGVMTKFYNQLILQSCSTLSGFICQSRTDDIKSRRSENASSFPGLASLAIDDIPSNCFYSDKSRNPWWSVTLSKMTYIHRISVVNTRSCCDISPATMETVVESSYRETGTTSERCGNLVSFRSDRLSYDSRCSPPIRGDRVRIHLIGHNAALVLCHVSIFAFDNLEEARGVSRQVWYNLINTQGMSTIRENTVFSTPPHGTSLLTDFSSKFEVSEDYGELLTTYIQVPSSGDYLFHLRCGDECELWINQYHERGLLLKQESIKGGIGKLLVQIQKWDGYNDSHRCVEASTASKVYLDKCHIYKLKLYMKEGSNFECLSVGMTTPSGPIEQPIRNEHLFSVQPGKRKLLFKVEGQTEITAGLGETIILQAKYSFCCHGIHCPNCSVNVDFYVFGKGYDVHQSLYATCEDHVFRVNFDAVVQPGRHDMEIIYSFSTASNAKGQRLIGHINVKVVVLQTETFSNGFGKWTTNDGKGWKIRSSSDDTFAYINEPISAELVGPPLPWKPFFSKVGLCLKFLYLMPNLSFSTFNVYLNKTGGKARLLWSLSGFHGHKWRHARVQWQAQDNTKIVFLGKSSINESISIAVDSVTITTEECRMTPRHATPGYVCSKDKFQCANGHCISLSQRCDNDLNCLDGSDERGCKCLTNELTCSTGECVKVRKLCDRKNDCKDGTDEKRCGGMCGINRFTCPAGKCLLWNSTCSRSDKIQEQCQDQSNNPSVCGTASCPLDNLKCKGKVPKRHKKCKYSFKGLCSFEHGFCGLKHDNTTKMLWTIGIGKTPSDNTGPGYDHSTWSDKGAYIFLETSQKLKGDKARLSSDWMSPGPPVCLQFWYHMYGQHIGALNIISRAAQEERTIWSAVGSKGDGWLHGQVEVELSDTTQFVIEGVSGTGNEGDIAVDDVILVEGNCVRAVNQVSPDCAFEQDTCNWTGDGFWVITDSTDDLSQNEERGRHLHLVDRASKTNHNITSVPLNGTTWACLRFWYYLGLGYSAKLAIDITETGTKSGQSVWSTTKMSNGWSFVQIPLHNIKTENYKVSFKAFSTGPLVAIDDISFSEVTCQSIPYVPYKVFIAPPGPKCSQSLGMQNFKIPDYSIQASSFYRNRTSPQKGRLHLAVPLFPGSTVYTGGWCRVMGRGPWLMVDFRQNMRITKVATQGKQELDFWVKTYYLRYQVNGGKSWPWYYSGSTRKVFTGNYDRHTPVYNHLVPPIIARYIMIYPLGYNGLHCLRVDYFGCPVEKPKPVSTQCDFPLGVQSGRVTDASITASSSQGLPHRARLYTVEEGGQLGAWVADNGDLYPWLQIDYGGIAMVTKIATQGRHGNSWPNNHYVRSYSISYSETGIVYDWFKHNGSIKVYQANTERNTPVYNIITPGLVARYVRLHPKTWSGRPAMRVEMYGCLAVNNAITSIENLGCYSDTSSSSSSIPSLENLDSVLEGNYQQRAGAILRCAEAAFKRGFDVFALQNGGKCLGGPQANQTYAKYGTTTACGKNGRGGLLASEVYRITRKCHKYNELCDWTKTDNGSSSWILTGKESIEREIQDIRTQYGDAEASSSEDFEAQLIGGAEMTSPISFPVSSAITVCFWVKCQHPGLYVELRSRDPVFVIQQRNSCRLEITILGMTTTADQCVCDNIWHHLCYTWKSRGGVWEMYFDGGLNSFGRWISGRKTLPALRYLIVKYQLNYSNASYKPLELTDLHVWDAILCPQEVLRMSYGCGGDGLSGDVISWNNLKMSGNFSLRKNPSCFSKKGSLYSSSSSNTSNLLSSWFKRSGTGHVKCIKFCYMLYGPGSQALQITQVALGDEMGERALWTNENSSSKWNYGQISVSAVTRSKVIFQSEFLDESRAFAAIGGLYSTDGYCTTVPQSASKACNLILTDTSGVITSTGYPGYYTADSSCSWTISLPKGQVVQLFFIIFELEKHPTCENDYLAVYDGTPFKSSLIGRYCGDVFPPMLESSTSTMGLVFKSNNKVTRKSFKFTYVAKNQSEDSSCSNQKDSCPTSCQCFYTSDPDKRLVVKGDSLLTVPKNIPPNTAVVLLAQSRIHHLKENDFSSLQSVEYIDVSNNVLLRVEDKAFSDLPAVHDIKLSTNFIKRLQPNAFNGLSSLHMLDLGENLVESISEDTFSTLRNLTVLSLRSNHITSLPRDLFKYNTNLQYLYLQNNKIEKIPDGLFSSLHKLKVLHLNNNRIKQVTFETFRGLRSLETLYLQNNKFSVVSDVTFNELDNLKHLKLDHFTLCCYAVKIIPHVDCQSKVDEFSSCDDLMKNRGLQVCIWVLGIFAFVGNIGVIIWRVAFSEDNKVHSYLLTNLAVSDFLMGVYLLIIAIKDAQWQGEYFKKDFEWRNGLLCQFTGALSMLSSEVSVLMLTVITTDRFISIVFAMRIGKLSYKKAVTICVATWIFGLIISLLPITGMTYFYDDQREMGFYGRSSVCLPLQLSSSRPAGWEYSVSFFIGLNFIAFLFIFIAYILMYLTVKKASTAARSKNAKKEAAMARKLLFIVLTDFFCWFPVILIGVLSLMGKFNDPQGIVYVWIAVFVLPVNSSINPILYTFSNANVKRKLVDYGKTVSGISGNHQGNSTAMHLSAVRDFERSRSPKTLLICKEKLATRNLPRGIPTLNRRVAPLVTKKLKVIEACDIFAVEKSGGKGYVTCWSEMPHESMHLLKYFDTEKNKNWVREVNTLKKLHSGRDHDNLMNYRWHSEADKLEIDFGKVDSLEILFSQKSRVICFAFESGCKSLVTFLQETGVNANIESLSAIGLDILKGVEHLHKHSISHGDLSVHTILIGKCRRIPPIKAIIGGFDQSSIVKGAKANQAYKADLQQVGQLLRHILDTCGYAGQFVEISDVIDMCFQACFVWRQRASEIRSQFEKVWGTSSVWDSAV